MKKETIMLNKNPYIFYTNYTNSVSISLDCSLPKVSEELVAVLPKKELYYYVLNELLLSPFFHVKEDKSGPFYHEFERFTKEIKEKYPTAKIKVSVMYDFEELYDLFPEMWETEGDELVNFIHPVVELFDKYKHYFIKFYDNNALCDEFIIWIEDEIAARSVYRSK